MQKGFWSKVIWIYCWTGAKCTVQPQIREWTTICQKKHTGWVTQPVCQPFQFNQSLIIEPYKCPPPLDFISFFSCHLQALQRIPVYHPLYLTFCSLSCILARSLNPPPPRPLLSIPTACWRAQFSQDYPEVNVAIAQFLQTFLIFSSVFSLSILVSQTKVRYSRRCQMVNPDVTDIWMWIFLRTFAPHGTFNSTYIYSFLVSAKSVKCICFGALLCR